MDRCCRALPLALCRAWRLIEEAMISSQSGWIRRSEVARYPDIRQGRGLTAIDVVTAILMLLLVIQMWLLTATLDSFLAGHIETATPAAIVSDILFGTCFILYRFVARADRQARSGQ
jgi:hypothetical protein